MAKYRKLRIGEILQKGDQIKDCSPTKKGWTNVGTRFFGDVILLFPGYWRRPLPRKAVKRKAK